MINQDNILILVCNGAEYQRVKKGLLNNQLLDKIILLPIGIEGVNQFLKSQHLPQSSIILIGLGGSLSSSYKVGEVLIYESCSYLHKNGKLDTKYCDYDLTNYLKNKLNVSLAKGLTTDNLIHSSTEKLALNKLSNCDIVDMETYAVMSYFQSVSIIRIISDNYNDNLPDLNGAINSEGKLDILKMTMAFLKEPIKALKLIKNALISLKTLEKISQQLTIINS
ncbi:hypothetical protein [Geminocystis sp.]|uniref:phosphorylase family protein n=1 Tax=Geminocystis sp. TaxID=2664100 RepID=UPI0035932CB7